MKDVFISHASEDKSAVARPLAELLRESGLDVWIDEEQLSLGDVLSRKIDDGLSRARYGIVVLSHSFFAKDWPRRELDALVAREESEGKVILPVWHGVEKYDVARYSPILAAKLAVSTDHGIEVVAKEVLEAVGKTSSLDHTRRPRNRARNSAASRPTRILETSQSHSSSTAALDSAPRLETPQSLPWSASRREPDTSTIHRPRRLRSLAVLALGCAASILVASVGIALAGYFAGAFAGAADDSEATPTEVTAPDLEKLPALGEFDPFLGLSPYDRLQDLPETLGKPTRILGDDDSLSRVFMYLDGIVNIRVQRTSASTSWDEAKLASVYVSTYRKDGALARLEDRGLSEPVFAYLGKQPEVVKRGLGDPDYERNRNYSYSLSTQGRKSRVEISFEVEGEWHFPVPEDRRVLKCISIGVIWRS